MNEQANPPQDSRALGVGDIGDLPAKTSHAAGVAVPDPIPAYRPSANEQVHFLEHWRILIRHRLLIITFLLMTVIAATIWTFRTQPVFTGTAMLRMEKEEPRIVKFEEVLKADTREDYNQTQYQILQSRTLAKTVIHSSNLHQHPDFRDLNRGWLAALWGWVRTQVNRWVPAPPPRTREADGEVDVASPMTDAFLSRLKVEPIRSSRLVRVSFDSHYPELAAQVTNTLAEAFIAQQLDEKAKATRYAAVFLGQQLDDAQKKLQDADARLNKFLKDNDILFLTSGRSGRPDDRDDLITHQLSSLSDTLLKARAERIARESLFVQALNRDVTSVPAVLSHPLISRLKEELANLEAEYRKLGQTFKPEYPRMQQLQQSIVEIRGQLSQETHRIVEGLAADHRAALRNEQELQQAVDIHRQLAKRLGDQMPQYTLLRRNVESNRDIYTALLTRLKETQISSSLITSNISLVDRAEVPRYPSRPRKALNLSLAVIVGLVGGIAIAFLVEHLDPTIKDPKEIGTILHVPTLGLVPSWAALDGQRIPARRQLVQRRDNKAPFGLLVEPELASIFTEAFRSLRTTLLYCARDRPPKTLMVTSLQTEEGKTTIAANLAIALADLGVGDVLLVDADMRHPTLHKLFDVPRVPGLSTFLAGEADVPDILRPSKISNLHIIPAGRRAGQAPTNAADFLPSPRLGQAIDVLAGRFAHIVFDTPPLLAVSDAMCLAQRVQGVVLVLRHRRASRDNAQSAIQMLASVHAPLLGVVLNDVNPRGLSGPFYRSYVYNPYVSTQ
jgi:polysaccharide biosynthesis transport protein